MAIQAQAQYIPQALSYQAVARDAQGMPIADEEIVVEISIIRSSADGTIEWQETHYPVTNALGLFSINIGKGISTYAGSKQAFSDIVWTDGPHFVKIRVDFGHSTFLNGFVDMGTVELQSVPYALVADSALKAPIPRLRELLDVNASGLLVGQVLKWNGTEWVAGDALGLDQFLRQDGSTDLTGNWTISSNSITLTNGNLTATNGLIQSASMRTSALAIGTKSINTVITDPTLAGVTDQSIASAQALKTYIDSKTGASSDWVVTGTTMYNLDKYVGIGIIPEDKFHAAVGQNGFLVTGNYNVSANIPNRSTGTRLAFYPGKSAFRAGTVETQADYWNDANVGDFSQAFGKDTKASGDYSVAFGLLNQANGAKSFVAGKSNIATGEYSVAFGLDNQVIGERSSAFGRLNESVGVNAMSVGRQNYAYGFNSIAIGELNKPEGDNSIAMGLENSVKGANALGGGYSGDIRGLYSFSWGNNNTIDAGAEGAVVFGQNNRARSDYSAAFGLGNITASYMEVVVGRYSYIDPAAPNNPDVWDASDRLFVVGNGSDIGSESNAMLIYKSGNTKINGNLTVSGTVSQASDERLKRNITPLSPSLQQLLQLKPVHYYWRYSQINGRKFSNDPQIGLIAQEVEKLFPELVSTDRNGYKSVNYTALIPIMIQAIKEQQQQINELRAGKQSQAQQIEQLQNQQASLVNRLERIENLLLQQAEK